ncbi:hypothetical protein [Treponema sp.]|uniref:hypothetical protein n=1 Tax=Treponema sp. TaxID=166 RepID=UPI00298DAB5D|nr:hypothetical protein [Treponema sp.]MCQ2240649.1 hypothetical protein [Treponema sp.]
MADYMLRHADSSKEKKIDSAARVFLLMFLSVMLCCCSMDDGSASRKSMAYEPELSGSTYYSIKDDYIEAKVSKGIEIFRQWMFSNGGKRLNATDFQMDIQLLKNMEYAGVEFFARGSPLNSYRFQIYSTGRFLIQKNEPYQSIKAWEDKWSPVLDLKPADSKVALSSFNRLELHTAENGDVQVSMNGKTILTIEKKDFIFKMPGELGMIFSTKRGLPLSEEEYAEARFKIVSYGNSAVSQSVVDDSKLDMDRTEVYGRGKIDGQDILLDHYQYSAGRGYVYTKGMYGGKLWLGEDGQYHGQAERTLLDGYSSGWAVGLVYPFNVKDMKFLEFTSTGKKSVNGTFGTKSREWSLTSGSTVDCKIDMATKKLNLTIKGSIQNSGVKKNVDLSYDGEGWE